MSSGQCIRTSRSVSVDADCTPQYVTALARAGLLPHIVASDGTRLFPDEASAIVRQIKADHLAKRGRKSGR
jgi:hypothetical protein